MDNTKAHTAKPDCCNPLEGGSCMDSWLQVSSVLQKQWSPEDNLIHHEQRMLCSLIYLPLYQSIQLHIRGATYTAKGWRKVNPELFFPQRKTLCTPWTKHHKLSMELEGSNIQVLLVTTLPGSCASRFTCTSFAHFLNILTQDVTLPERLLQIKNPKKKAIFYLDR